MRPLLPSSLTRQLASSRMPSSSAAGLLDRVGQRYRTLIPGGSFQAGHASADELMNPRTPDLTVLRRRLPKAIPKKHSLRAVRL